MYLYRSTFTVIVAIDHLRFTGVFDKMTPYHKVHGLDKSKLIQRHELIP